jgi:hypothetical protein
MNTTESSPANNAVTLHTEQPASVSVAEEKDLTNNFYVVGGVINIVMISAYFIWAFRAWKKSDKRKGR